MNDLNCLVFEPNISFIFVCAMCTIIHILPNGHVYYFNSSILFKIFIILNLNQFWHILWFSGLDYPFIVFASVLYFTTFSLKCIGKCCISILLLLFLYIFFMFSDAYLQICLFNLFYVSKNLDLFQSPFNLCQFSYLDVCTFYILNCKMFVCHYAVKISVNYCNYISECFRVYWHICKMHP